MTDTSPDRAHREKMSSKAEEKMWRKFRKVDTQRQQLATSMEDMEEQEAFACERADLMEKEVIRRTKKFGRLVREKGESCISSRLKIVFPPCRGMGRRVEEPGRGKSE
jgi:hypothetical protein